MYTIAEEFGSLPFAIVKNRWQYRVEQAIREEFCYEEAALLEDLEEVDFPDWGENKEVDYVARDDDGERVSGSIIITKLVDY